MATTYQDDYDSPWKEIISLYFSDFMELFFPAAYADIDWPRGYEFLDQELQQVVRDAKTGNRRVDKLVKVWLKDGQETWILIHIEVQSQYDVEFPERMYIYNYRTYDRYRKPVVSLAILSDENPNWRPTEYSYGRWGSQASLKFVTTKLLDYRQHWATLELNPNPFAVVVMAHLKTQETRQDPEVRQYWKFILTRMLYERGYSKQDIIKLYGFIDWVMTLPPAYEQSFQLQLSEMEEEKKMKYVTAIERYAEQRGMKQGVAKGVEQGIEQGTVQTLRSNILFYLEVRFQTIPNSLVEILDSIQDGKSLEQLFKQVVVTDSVTNFTKVAMQALQKNDTITTLEN